VDARYRIDWETEVGRLSAIEPGPDEVRASAAELAAGYSDPRNAELMGHAEPISAEEVVALYADAVAAGRRPFLLYRDGALVGDADLRGVRDGAAEFAFMIAAPNTQGRGLGTRFAMMVHAFGFAQLGLARIYASIVPHNAASRRVFEKLGYAVDDSAEARRFADEPDDVTLALDREVFDRAHAAELARIRVAARG